MATTRFLGQVGGFTNVIFGTLSGASSGVLAAAGNYDANDIWSNSATNGAGVAWLFSDAAKDIGGTGVIVGVTATLSVDNITPRLRLWVFNANPSASELDDNAALSIAAADRTKLMGYVDLPGLADAGAISYSQVFNLVQPFKCASTSRDLYGIVQTLDAVTGEAADMTLTVALHVLQD